MADEADGPDGGPKEPAELFHRLREQLLSGTAASHGLAPEGRVWGVVMEMGYPEGTATVACLSDGRASVLFSHGGAMLGGGQHQDVQLRAEAIVREADRFVGLAEPAARQPLPKVGCISTYFLTDTEILVAQASEQTLRRGEHELAPLVHAGETLVTEIVRIASAQEQGEEPD